MYPEVEMAASIAVIALILLALFTVGKGIDEDEHDDD